MAMASFWSGMKLGRLLERELPNIENHWIGEPISSEMPRLSAYMAQEKENMKLKEQLAQSVAIIEEMKKKYEM